MKNLDIWITFIITIILDGILFYAMYKFRQRIWLSLLQRMLLLTVVLWLAFVIIGIGISILASNLNGVAFAALFGILLAIMFGLTGLLAEWAALKRLERMISSEKEARLRGNLREANTYQLYINIALKNEPKIKEYKQRDLYKHARQMLSE